MKRLVLCAAAVALLSLTVMGKTYYVPHIHTANNSWETHLLLSNSSPLDVARCTVNLYDADGVLVMTFYPSVDPGETIDYSLRTYGGVSGTVDCPADFVSVRLGFVASESSGGGTAEFNLPDHLSDAAVLNLSGYYDQLTWSGFAVFNGTDQDVTVTPRYFDTDGLSHTGTAFTLEAMQKRVDYFENLLGETFDNLSSVIFETDTDALTAIIISGNENEKLLFTPSDNTADSWEVVDRYSPAGMIYNFYPVGQATTADYVLYAVSSSVGFGFQNLVKCFDATNGELVWETNVESEMEGHGLVASASGDYVYLYGQILASGSTNYYVYCLAADTGEIVNTAMYGHSGSFPSEERFKNQIHVASTGGTVYVAYQIPTGVIRRLYNEDMSIAGPSSTWSDLDTVVTDVATYSGEYYLIRTDWNDGDHVYNLLNIFISPFDSLSGGGLVQELENLRFDGQVNHVFADGAYVKGDDMYMMLKVCIGNPYGGSMGNLNISAADLVPVYYNLATHSISTMGVQHGSSTIMGAYTSSFDGPDSAVYVNVSGWYRSSISVPELGGVRSFGSTFRDPFVMGDHLYIVAWDIEWGDLTGSSMTNVVRVRKTSFADFFANGTW